MLFTSRQTFIFTQTKNIIKFDLSTCINILNYIKCKSILVDIKTNRVIRFTGGK